jgi:1-acyl-sn-glycerol-3-phosphate acyltransferase
LPDADVIPFGQPGDPERGGSAAAPLGPSKAARLVGNTGPQPTAPGVPARTQPRVPSVATTAGAAAVHAGDAPAPPEVWSDDEIPLDEGWLDFVRRRMSGEYGVDDFGFDPELTDKVFLALMRPLYRSWFRVETTGLENVPSDSGALIVGNHSGVIALDAAMTQVALHDEHPAHRHLRMLGANLVFQMPVMGEIARKAGHTLACHPDAERLLGAGELVGVWPEGFKGVGKPFSQRYKLQRFGRGGFVAAALRTRAPIIPTAIVGAEEIYPMVANAKTVARILGLPYFPITPTFPWLGPLGMVPLPSKWHIHFGEPIPTDHFPEGAADDPMVVFNLTDQVREQIQQSLYRLLVKRPSAFG